MVPCSGKNLLEASVILKLLIKNNIKNIGKKKQLLLFIKLNSLFPCFIFFIFILEFVTFKDQCKKQHLNIQIFFKISQNIVAFKTQIYIKQFRIIFLICHEWQFKKLKEKMFIITIDQFPTPMTSFFVLITPAPLLAFFVLSNHPHPMVIILCPQQSLFVLNNYVNKQKY